MLLQGSWRAAVCCAKHTSSATTYMWWRCSVSPPCAGVTCLNTTGGSSQAALQTEPAPRHKRCNTCSDQQTTLVTRDRTLHVDARKMCTPGMCCIPSEHPQQPTPITTFSIRRAIETGPVDAFTWCVHPLVQLVASGNCGSKWNNPASPPPMQEPYLTPMIAEQCPFLSSGFPGMGSCSAHQAQEMWTLPHHNSTQGRIQGRQQMHPQRQGHKSSCLPGVSRRQPNSPLSTPSGPATWPMTQ